MRGSEFSGPREKSPPPTAPQGMAGDQFFRPAPVLSIYGPPVNSPLRRRCSDEALASGGGDPNFKLEAPPPAGCALPASSASMLSGAVSAPADIRVGSGGAAC